jgi:hypothetical protein
MYLRGAERLGGWRQVIVGDWLLKPLCRDAVAWGQLISDNRQAMCGELLRSKAGRQCTPRVQARCEAAKGSAPYTLPGLAPPSVRLRIKALASHPAASRTSPVRLT